jgi:transcriptional regulator with XRE-family HTH domain
MTLVSENIKFLRKKAGLTQEQFSNHINIKRSLLGAYEEGRADPRLSNLLSMAKYFNIPVDDLISRELSKLNKDELSKTKRHEVKVLTVSVDSTGKENIEWVPVKAAAGYTSGFGDEEFIESLPKFSLPYLSKNRTYRAFEISGDSMLPVESGSIVVGAYLSEPSEIKNGKTYVLVTKNEGIVYKRLFLDNENGDKVYLVSDNHLYAPYYLDMEEVMEVWEAVNIITSVRDENSDTSKQMSVEQLAGVVLELKEEIRSLKASL